MKTYITLVPIETPTATTKDI